MATYTVTKQNADKTYSDIYFTKGSLKGSCFFQCGTTRIMVDIFKTPCGKRYETIFENMDSHEEYRQIHSTLKGAKEGARVYLNARISKLSFEIKTVEISETIETLEIIEDQEIDLNEIMGIDTIDEQLFASDDINDIVGIDLIDSQLFPTGKENDVNIDDLIVELDDNNWLVSCALTAIDNLLPIGFMVLKSGDDLLKIFGRNTIARVLIEGENRLNVIWHNESLPSINIDSVMEIINDIINDPDDLLFGKGIKVELV